MIDESTKRYVYKIIVIIITISLAFLAGFDCGKYYEATRDLREEKIMAIPQLDSKERIKNGPSVEDLLHQEGSI